VGDVIAKEIYDKESKESFSFKKPYAMSTLDGRVPVSFAGQSVEGDIYEAVGGSLFLVRHGTEEAEKIG